MTRRVIVWGKPQEVTIAQKSKTVWIATGEYMGQRIETKGASQSANVGGRQQSTREMDRLAASTSRVTEKQVGYPGSPSGIGGAEPSQVATRRRANNVSAANPAYFITG